MVARASGRAPLGALALAKEAHSDGRLATAAELYAAAIETTPADAAEAHRCLGILLAQTNRLKEAIEHLKAGLRIDPNNATALNDLGTLYRRAGQEDDAIESYRRAIARRPNFAAAHLHLGSALHQQGRLIEAAESYRHAVAIEPRLADAYLNLGVALHQLEDHPAAEVAFRRTLDINPLSLAAHFNLGICLAAQGRVKDAIDAYRAALKSDPDAAPVHVNLGMALEQTHALEEAIACYRRAIEIDPAMAVAFHNLGCALRTQGHLADAIEAFQTCVALDPGSAIVHVDLGAALDQRGLHDEAILSYRRAIQVDSMSLVAHRALAVALNEHGLLDEAFAHFRRHADLAYRAPRGPAERATAMKPYRLKHDREQLDYLAANGIAPGAQALRGTIGGDSASREDFERGFATLFHIEGGEAIETPAIGLRDDKAEIEARWDRSTPKIVVIDGLLSPRALSELNRFCWGSTMWWGQFRDGYLGAVPESGFAAPLILQISSELVAAFPRIFSGHPLRYCWGIKCDSELPGVGVHADFAAVNVNFWITSDKANLDRDRGGLIIWDKPAPLEWTNARYNNVETTEVREFLARSGATSVTIPYRANRAVIFDSDLFHETDRILFKEGYLNRRINITLLYGIREHDTAAPHGAGQN